MLKGPKMKVWQIKKFGYILTASSLVWDFTSESRKLMGARSKYFVIFVQSCKLGPIEYVKWLLPTKPEKFWRIIVQRCPVYNSPRDIKIVVIVMNKTWIYLKQLVKSLFLFDKLHEKKAPSTACVVLLFRLA